MSATTLAAILSAAKARLSVADIDDPSLEARMIVEHFSGTNRTDAIARSDLAIPDAVAATIKAAIERRLSGEPVHRIFGWRDFHGVRLVLSPDTLEPRPDTETLVDAVLPLLRDTIARSGRVCFADLGTGSGAIAIALLAALPATDAIATDIAAGALETAADNAKAAGVSDRLELIRSDWFSAVEGRFDAILSNPPYIPSNDIAGLQREVRDFDPRRALDGGPDGLDAYRAIAIGAVGHLEAAGFVAVEIGSTQRSEVEAVFEAAGYVTTGFHRDLAGSDRVLIFERKIG